MASDAARVQAFKLHINVVAQARIEAPLIAAHTSMQLLYSVVHTGCEYSNRAYVRMVTPGVVD
jgi:hypothetical protein